MGIENGKIKPLAPADSSGSKIRRQTILKAKLLSLPE